jgi:DNA-binding MarR family transcriptional regulator
MALKNEASLFLRLHRAIREFPRYNRFLVKAHETQLTPVEAHILVELDCTPNCLQKDLGLKLAIDKVPLSRLITKLQDAGLLESETNPKDRRELFLNLTHKGEKILLSFDSQANAKLDAFTSAAGLMSSQVSKLAKFFHKLADGLNAPQSTARRDEHILRASIRRLTRAFGLLGGTSLGSDLALSEWQVLLTAAEHSGRFTPSVLSELLGVDRTAIAVTLRVLKEKSLILKKKSPNDSRSELIHCTKLGFRLIAKIENLAVRDFESLSSDDIEDVILVERFIRGAALDFFLHQRQLAVTPIKEERDFQLVRRLKMLEICSPNYSKKVAGSLFSEENLCVGLYQDANLLAAIELKENSSKNSNKYTLVNLFSSENLHPDSVRALIVSATKSKLTSPIDIELREYAEILRPSPMVSSTLGALF